MGMCNARRRACITLLLWLDLQDLDQSYGLHFRAQSAACTSYYSVLSFQALLYLQWLGWNSPWQLCKTALRRYVGWLQLITAALCRGRGARLYAARVISALGRPPAGVRPCLSC